MKVQNSSITDKFFKGIKKEIDEKDITQQMVALELGWSESKISKKLSGNRITLDDAYALASYFGCTIDEIIFPEKYDSTGIPVVLYKGITKDLHTLIKDFFTIYKKMKRHKTSKLETKK